MNDNKSTGNQEVIQRLKSAEALYVLISGCTKEPYIVCDPESFDDETYMFFTPEDAQAKAGELAGGNIDVTILSRVISRGLLKTGRSADITIELVDKPGQLSDVSRIIAETGGNVVAVHHDRSGENTNVNGCYLHLVMETRDHAHILEIENALTNQGYKIIGRERRCIC